MRELAKAFLRDKSAHGKQPHFDPCVITQVSPLQISLNGLTGVDALKVDGLNYTLNANALALYTSPGIPLVFPIV